MNPLDPFVNMENPKDPKKSFLTHSKKQEEAKPPFESGRIVEAQPASGLNPVEAALSEKMAKISSIRESGGPMPDTKSFALKNKGASSLPRAMAKVHQKYQEDKIREQLTGQSASDKPMGKKPNLSGDLKVEDPQPGPEKSLLWFVFAYGNFAKGVLLAQSLPLTVLFWMICGLGSIQISMRWLSPLGGPEPIYNSLFTSSVLAGGMLLGMGVYWIVSLLIYAVLRRKTGGIGKHFGLKVVVNAFLPLAIGQLLMLIYATFSLGESFWRGQVPEGYPAFSDFILPALWIWGGYRVAQAIAGLFTLTFPARLWLKIGITAGMTVPLLMVAGGLPRFYQKAVNRDWATLKIDFMASSDPLPQERFDELEKRLPFRDVERKRDLYLYRMQNLYRQDLMDAARADALRLDRMALSGSAEDELAKGLNYLFQNRLDLAIPRLESAIKQNPDCYPAHQWLALGLVATDIERSEEHAQTLMRVDPNVFHLQLLVRILFAQGKYQEIWDAMLTVDAPPETWDPLTLHQGGVAAKVLGKVRRSELLFSLSRSKGLESKME